MEVTVSKILRMILRMENTSIFRLAAIHAASLPFLGGGGVLAGGYLNLNKRLADGNATYAEQFADGAKGCSKESRHHEIVNKNAREPKKKFLQKLKL